MPSPPSPPSAPSDEGLPWCYLESDDSMDASTACPISDVLTVCIIILIIILILCLIAVAWDRMRCGALCKIEIDAGVGDQQVHKEYGCEQLLDYLFCGKCKKPDPRIDARTGLRRTYVDVGTSMNAKDLFVHHTRQRYDDLGERERSLWSQRDADNVNDASASAALTEAHVFSMAAADSQEAFWGFSREMATQVDLGLLGKAAAADAATQWPHTDGSGGGGTHSVSTQMVPMLVPPGPIKEEIVSVVDGSAPAAAVVKLSADDGAVAAPAATTEVRRVPFVHFVDFPAIGSIFAGPWQCVSGRFYEGLTCQVEFADDQTEWEPQLHELKPFPPTSSFSLIPLVALWHRVPPPEGAGGGGAKMSSDDGGTRTQAEWRCYVASASADGRTLAVSRSYSTAADGHAGHVWTLRRVGRTPPEHEYRHALNRPLFAGSWRDDGAGSNPKDPHFFMSGATIEIEPNGYSHAWGVASAEAASGEEFLKVDLLDLVERRLVVEEGAADDAGGVAEVAEEEAEAPPAVVVRTQISADDAGTAVAEPPKRKPPKRKPPKERKAPPVFHHIGSLSKSHESLSVSTEYGAPVGAAASTAAMADVGPDGVADFHGLPGVGSTYGHLGNKWTLRRVAHDGEEFVRSDGITYRSYKHQYPCRQPKRGERPLVGETQHVVERPKRQPPSRSDGRSPPKSPPKTAGRPPPSYEGVVTQSSQEEMSQLRAEVARLKQVVNAGGGRSALGSGPALATPGLYAPPPGGRRAPPPRNFVQQYQPPPPPSRGPPMPQTVAQARAMASSRSALGQQSLSATSAKPRLAPL